MANGSRVPAWPTFLTVGAQQPPHARHDVVRRAARRLVDQEDAVERRLASSELSHALTSSGASSLENPAASAVAAAARSGGHGAHVEAAASAG